MNDNTKDLQILRHISRYCDEISKTLEFYNFDEAQMKNNFIMRNAIAMPLLQIGELAKRLSKDFRNDYSEVPWHEIAGMRNTIAREYLKIKIHVIWKTIINDIPALKQYCTFCMDELSKSELTAKDLAIELQNHTNDLRTIDKLKDSAKKIVKTSSKKQSYTR